MAHHHTKKSKPLKRLVEREKPIDNQSLSLIKSFFGTHDQELYLESNKKTKVTELPMKEKTPPSEKS